MKFFMNYLKIRSPRYIRNNEIARVCMSMYITIGIDVLAHHLVEKPATHYLCSLVRK